MNNVAAERILGKEGQFGMSGCSNKEKKELFEDLTGLGYQFNVLQTNSQYKSVIKYFKSGEVQNA